MNDHLHRLYMRRCFDLARKGIPDVEPNPPVGAVLVYNQSIIGEGYHKQHGQPHAEANAIQSVLPANQHLLSKSTLFVSLEPCCTTGLTPPCVDLIRKHKIPRVVISCQDPNPQISGKSVQILSQTGVEVITGIMFEEGQNLIGPFLKRMERQLPYITIKVAIDQVGNMASKDKSVWLSNDLSKLYVHKIRSKVGAILVGTQTAIIDNPSLTNRLYTGRSPVRILVDRNNQIPRTHQLFSDQVNTKLFVKEIPENNYNHIEYIGITEDISLNEQILNHLYISGINTLLIEGGATVIKSFLQKDLCDELIIIRTPKMIEANPVHIDLEFGKIIDRFSLGLDEIEIRKDLS